MFKIGSLVRVKFTWRELIVNGCSSIALLGVQSDTALPLKNAIGEVIQRSLTLRCIIWWPQFKCYLTLPEDCLVDANATTTENT